MFNLDNFIIILDQTTHSGNLGSVARIVKNMGIKHVRLVNPKSDPLDDQAKTMSAHACDVLKSFTIYDNLEQATADTSIILATSARKRAFSPRIITPHQILSACLYNTFKSSNTLSTLIDNKSTLNSFIDNQLSNIKIAILFGTENSGLTNKALQMSNYHIVIDCNPEYTSLNLSMAVLVMAYELRKQMTEFSLNQSDTLQNLIQFIKTTSNSDLKDLESVDFDIENNSECSQQKSSSTSQDHNFEPLATHQQIEHFLHRLEAHLTEIGFTQHPGTMERLRLLIYRSQLNTKELAVLQGIITSQNQIITKLSQQKVD